MIDKPHDALVKAIFSKVEHAAELFRTGLPGALAQHIEFDTLAPLAASFIDDLLRESATDLLFAVSCVGQEVLLLLEHLSTVQRRAIVRLWCYVGDATMDYLARNRAAKSTPLVIPYVLHHSEQGWTAPRDMRGFIEQERALHQVLRPYVPGFRFVLDDLSVYTDEELRARAMSAVPKLTLWALKNARNSQALEATLHNWVDVFQEAVDTSRDEVVLIVRYTLEVSDSDVEHFKDLLAREVGPRAEEIYMTAAEALRNEGRREGRREGRDQGRNEGRDQAARAMLRILLQQRFGELLPELAARIDQARADQVERWFRRAITAESQTEVITEQ